MRTVVTDTWGDRWAISLTERADKADPADIEPLHEVRDAKKLEALVASMGRGGWQGRPILVSARDGRFFAYTGSHRIAAARAAGLDQVPVVVIEIAEEPATDGPATDGVEDEEGTAVEFDEFGRLVLGDDDDARATPLREWGLPLSLALMEQEIAQN